MALDGLTVPMLTAFREEGGIDTSRNARFARGLCDARVNHVFLLGSMGEFPSLDPGEREPLLESVIESLTWGVDAWVGCGAPSTRQAIRLAEEAEAAGAAAIVAVPPYYLHPTMESIARYYRAIHEAVKLPLLAYNIPSLVGYPLPASLLHRLAAEGVLVGAKNTAGSMESVVEYLTGAPPGFTVLPGDDRLALESIQRGAPGAIMGLANIVPKLCVSLIQRARAGDIEAARPLNDLLGRLAGVASQGPFPSTAKFLAQELRGATVGYNSPYDPLTPEEESRVQSALAPLRAELAPYL